jgi:hypothetical protein
LSRNKNLGIPGCGVAFHNGGLLPSCVSPAKRRNFPVLVYGARTQIHHFAIYRELKVIGVKANDTGCHS